MADDSKAYYRGLGDDVLGADATMPAGEFLARCLSPRNMVVSASAVLWRRAALADALAAVAPEQWLCAGDWRVYAEACAAGAEAGGCVAYVAAPLNEHRRHGGSVTGKTPRGRQWGEVVAMQAWLRRRLGGGAEGDAAMRQHLDNLRRSWDLPGGRAGG